MTAASISLPPRPRTDGAKGGRPNAFSDAPRGMRRPVRAAKSSAQEGPSRAMLTSISTLRKFLLYVDPKRRTYTILQARLMIPTTATAACNQRQALSKVQHHSSSALNRRLRNQRTKASMPSTMVNMPFRLQRTPSTTSRLTELTQQPSPTAKTSPISSTIQRRQLST